MRSAQASELVFDAQWSPSGSHVACSLVTGYVEIFDVSKPEPTKTAAWQRHKHSCRSTRYFSDDRVLSGSADGSIACGKEEKPEWTKDAGGDNTGVNALLTWGEHCFVSGDDEGLINVYDTRIAAKSGPMMSFEEQSDYISDMLFGRDDHLVASSGDMTLGVYDLRKKKLFALSDEQEDEILSITLVKNGEKVVCGGMTGVLSIFQWGDFGDQKDRITDHPSGVNSIIKLREDAVITGADDGKLRVVSVYSQSLGNRIVSMLGTHGETPVESLTLSPDGKELVSCSHDPIVRFWSVEKALAALDVDAGNQRPAKKPKTNHQEESTKKLEAKSFFSDM